MCHLTLEAVFSKVPSCSTEVAVLVLVDRVLPKVAFASSLHGLPGSFSGLALSLTTLVVVVLATLEAPVTLSSALLA